MTQTVREYVRKRIQEEISQYEKSAGITEKQVPFNNILMVLSQDYPDHEFVWTNRINNGNSAEDISIEDQNTLVQQDIRKVSHALDLYADRMSDDSQQKLSKGDPTFTIKEYPISNINPYGRLEMRIAFAGENFTQLGKNVRGASLD